MVEGERSAVRFSSAGWGLGWPSIGALARAPGVPDGNTMPSAALVPVTPVFTNTERLALAGFLAGYTGVRRRAYGL